MNTTITPLHLTKLLFPLWGKHFLNRLSKNLQVYNAIWFTIVTMKWVILWMAVCMLWFTSHCYSHLQPLATTILLPVLSKSKFDYTSTKVTSLHLFPTVIDWNLKGCTQGLPSAMLTLSISPTDLYNSSSLCTALTLASLLEYGKLFPIFSIWNFAKSLLKTFKSFLITFQSGPYSLERFYWAHLSKIAALSYLWTLFYVLRALVTI